MHRFIAGTCTMHLKLTPQEPWIVRGEDHERKGFFEPLLDERNQPILPASSLKGVLRSTAEYILRSVDPERPTAVRPLADLPFIHAAEELKNCQRGDIADSELLEWNKISRCYSEEELEPKRIYRLLSAATQLFGATTHAGLASLTDARLQQKLPQRWPLQTHVAIDRFTGGVGQGPFQEQMVPHVRDGQPLSLEATLTITNFALWQIGLLGLVFREISRGYIGIGAGTRKGRGRVQIDVTSVEFRYADICLQEPGVVLGIHSAQALILRMAGADHDVPAEVSLEASCLLCKDSNGGESKLLQPVHSDWRHQGTTAVRLDDTKQLLREAVEGPWCSWVNYHTDSTRARR